MCSRYGSYGETVQCTPGYLAVSLCSSGRRSDCEGNSHTVLQCCLETAEVDDPEGAVPFLLEPLYYTYRIPNPKHTLK